ncbi:prenyltransferase/squalene oxidase repeat-containing protein [Dehalogenimonas alkenigignens]|uniref:Uncharacterized protein conserved in archaea n=1 Tax=Dehalogenimonas alkenigignens TaxID=1217799 RepID=A0A0W0GLB9_9CHLR|nr:prenyltransferase/squalene oxidase repeat-containing protein [Dehalogenimonas alkenigignens]KTB49346.1 Uncharacterized protein conserved in archaea [Dehalogenimonas alkenigignens]
MREDVIENLLEGAVQYIESCRLVDGGYFFARVPPSSGLDTYFAVMGLSLLGLKPVILAEVEAFVHNGLLKDEPVHLGGLFVAAETLDKLGCLTDELKYRIRRAVTAFKNQFGGYGAFEHLDVAIPSELQGTYRAMKVLHTIGANRIDAGEVGCFVENWHNGDGGYGGRGRSNLASTFFATSIACLGGFELIDRYSTIAYLRRKETNREYQYIEDLYWLATALDNLGGSLADRSGATEFVRRCRRRGGGFARATAIGIPTLEYTFYALSILKLAGCQARGTLKIDSEKL